MFSHVQFKSSPLVFLLQVRAERVGVEGEGKARGDERRAGLVPAGPRRRLLPRRLLPFSIRHRVRGGGFILVRYPAVCFFFFWFSRTVLSQNFYFILFQFASRPFTLQLRGAAGEQSAEERARQVSHPDTTAHR